MFRYSEETQLADVLKQLDRSAIDFRSEVFDDVRHSPDFSVKETLSSKLVAKTSKGIQLAEAVIPFASGLQVYRILADGRRYNVNRTKVFGGGACVPKQYHYEVKEGSTLAASFVYFPNTNFVFTNKEKCVGLTLLTIGEKQYLYYRKDIPKSWLTIEPTGVFVDESLKKVAATVDAGSWFLSENLFKSYEHFDNRTLAFFMVVRHGLVFRNT